MIALRMHDKEGAICVMLVLEPGNIEKLKNGQPIHKWLNEFIPELPTQVELLFAYTPDAEWVVEKMRSVNGDALKFAELLQESLKLPPVLVRDKRAEDMEKMQ